jgi:hypothetical protein
MTSRISRNCSNLYMTNRKQKAKITEYETIKEYTKLTSSYYIVIEHYGRVSEILRCNPKTYVLKRIPETG